MSPSQGTATAKAGNGRGNFFAIDRRNWAALCDLGDINAASSYLLLAQGSCGNNATTSWSKESVKKHLGIAWNRAGDALSRLETNNFLQPVKESSPLRPRRKIVPFTERVSSAEQKKHKLPEGDDGLLWLPNAIVTDTSAGEDSPLRRLRAAGDMWALRLFVDLYHAHNLRDDGGIDRSLIWGKYERKVIGQQGPYSVVAFKYKTRTFFLEGPFEAHASRPRSEGADHPAWDTIELLERMGLLAFVPHLMENSSPQAEIIHPLGREKGAEEIEQQLERAATRAAWAMCLDKQLEDAFSWRANYYCPVPNTLPDAQLVGIARLHYRPHTRRTADWYGDLMNSAPGYIARYQELAAKAASVRKCC